MVCFKRMEASAINKFLPASLQTERTGHLFEISVDNNEHVECYWVKKHQKTGKLVFGLVCNLFFICYDILIKFEYAMYEWIGL